VEDSLHGWKWVLRGRTCQIRRLQDDDQSQVLSLLSRAFAEMRYAESGLSYDDDSAWRTIRQPCMRVNVALDGELIVGVSCLAILLSPFNQKDLLATEIVWHAEPRLPRASRFRIMLALLRAMSATALQEGVQSLRVNPMAPPVSRGLRRVLGRLGFRAQHLCVGRAI
jgi:hypothetical protein